MVVEYDPDKRKLLSALAHGSIFFSSLVVSIAIPIAILFVSEDPIVKESAKEAINFHLNVWVYEVIVGVLVFITLGLLGFNPSPHILSFPLGTANSGNPTVFEQFQPVLSLPVYLPHRLGFSPITVYRCNVVGAGLTSPSVGSLNIIKPAPTRR